MTGNRNKSIEIRISDISGIPEDIIKKYDIALSSKQGCHILWIHPTPEYYPFDRELMQYLTAVKEVYNRRTKSDHLDLYIEALEIDEFGIEVNEKKYKNITWNEIITGKVDMKKVILKKELDVIS